MGTRFTVSQTPAGGSVELHQGAIRFVDGKSVVVLRPGDRLVWPLPPSGRPAEARGAAIAPAPAPTSAPLPPVPPRRASITELIGEVEARRDRGDFRGAAQLLARVLGERSRLAPDTRERLSFELGSILSDQLGWPARACAHWAEHDARFPDGRYAAEVAQVRGRLQCRSLAPDDPHRVP
jgi:transmembrane sensor